MSGRWLAAALALAALVVWLLTTVGPADDSTQARPRQADGDRRVVAGPPSAPPAPADATDAGTRAPIDRRRPADVPVAEAPTPTTAEEAPEWGDVFVFDAESGAPPAEARVRFDAVMNTERDLGWTDRTGWMPWPNPPRHPGTLVATTDTHWGAIAVDDPSAGPHRIPLAPTLPFVGRVETTDGAPVLDSSLEVVGRSRDRVGAPPTVIAPVDRLGWFEVRTSQSLADLRFGLRGDAYWTAHPALVSPTEAGGHRRLTVRPIQAGLIRFFERDRPQVDARIPIGSTAQPIRITTTEPDRPWQGLGTTALLLEDTGWADWADRQLDAGLLPVVGLFDSPAPGRVRVSTTLPGYEPAEVELALRPLADGPPPIVEFPLHRTAAGFGELSVELPTWVGETIGPGWDLILTDLSEDGDRLSYRLQTLDDEGRYLVSNLPSGRYGWTVAINSYSPSSAVTGGPGTEVTIGVGERSELSPTLPPGGALELDFVDERGDSYSGWARVALLAVDDITGIEPANGAIGGAVSGSLFWREPPYAQPWLPAGQYRFTVWTPGHVAVERSGHLDLAAGDVTRLSIRLVPATDR